MGRLPTTNICTSREGALKGRCPWGRAYWPPLQRTPTQRRGEKACRRRHAWRPELNLNRSRALSREQLPLRTGQHKSSALTKKPVAWSAQKLLPKAKDACAGRGEVPRPSITHAATAAKRGTCVAHICSAACSTRCPNRLSASIGAASASFDAKAASSAAMSGQSTLERSAAPMAPCACECSARSTGSAARRSSSSAALLSSGPQWANKASTTNRPCRFCAKHAKPPLKRLWTTDRLCSNIPCSKTQATT
mmetsp:Transcript_120538/g.346304  ORF Transcript_120538/g.346304 Transcript_120538/m.346304 type:complete len:250 (-) Transcript_120538:171-920(-)